LEEKDVKGKLVINVDELEYQEEKIKPRRPRKIGLKR